MIHKDKLSRPIISVSRPIM